MNEENSKQNEKKPMDKKTLIIIGVALLLVVVIALVFIFKPNGGTTNKPEEQKITLTGREIDGGKLLITAKNTKKSAYDIEFNVTFYDEANQQIKEYQESILAIESNKEGYHTINISDVLGKKYKFSITKETEIANDKILSDQVQVNQSVVGETALDVEYQNNSDKNIDTVQVAVLFYKDDKVIDYTSQYISDVDAKGKRRELVMIPTNEKGDVIRFDKHEVIIKAYNNAN